MYFFCFQSCSDLNRSLSLTNISQRRVEDDLDDETLSNLKQNNKNAKSFFEASATKYRFGGSLANIVEDVKVKTKSNKIVDDRSWVLESINKHFDVIMEENEEESDDEEYYYSDSDDEYEKGTEEVCSEGALKSSFQMQSLLRSVVSQITTKDQTLDENSVLNNLKRQLENRS